MPDLQDIFKSIRLKSLSPSQAKAFNMIRVCRTSTLGSHAQVCTDCGSMDVSFNSCRNRHCPKCQHSVQQEWVEFRGKFLDLLKQAYNNGELAFFNEANKLALRSNFLALVDNLYGMNWVVFCKKPFKSPGHVVRYLGRYTHRVAISNSRIQEFNGQSVSFAWRDYRDGNKSKVMTLDAAEFSRRFFLHVLPNRFVKIRHYGLLCSRNIKSKLYKCMKITGNKHLSLTIKVQKEIKNLSLLWKCSFYNSTRSLFFSDGLKSMIVLKLNSYGKLPNLGRGRVYPFLRFCWQFFMRKR